MALYYVNRPIEQNVWHTHLMYPIWQCHSLFKYKMCFSMYSLESNLLDRLLGSLPQTSTKSSLEYTHRVLIQHLCQSNQGANQTPESRLRTAGASSKKKIIICNSFANSLKLYNFTSFQQFLTKQKITLPCTQVCEVGNWHFVGYRQTVCKLVATKLKIWNLKD